MYITLGADNIETRGNLSMKLDIRNKTDKFVGAPWSGQDRFELVGQFEGQSCWNHLSFWQRRYQAQEEMDLLNELQSSTRKQDTKKCQEKIREISFVHCSCAKHT